MKRRFSEKCSYVKPKEGRSKQHYLSYRSIVHAQPDHRTIIYGWWYDAHQTERLHSLSYLHPSIDLQHIHTARRSRRNTQSDNVRDILHPLLPHNIPTVESKSRFTVGIVQRKRNSKPLPLPLTRYDTRDGVEADAAQRHTRLTVVRPSRSMTVVATSRQAWWRYMLHLLHQRTTTHRYKGIHLTLKR